MPDTVSEHYLPAPGEPGETSGPNCLWKSPISLELCFTDCLGDFQFNQIGN